MGTEKTDSHGPPQNPSFPSSDESLSFTNLHPSNYSFSPILLDVDSAFSGSRGQLYADLSTFYPGPSGSSSMCSSTDFHFQPRQGGNVGMPSLLDTRKWSPQSPNVVGPCTTLELQVPQWPAVPHSNATPFIPPGPGHGVSSKPQTTLGAQLVPDTSSGLSSFMGHHHETTNPDPNHLPVPALVPPATVEDVEKQPLVVLHQSPVKKSSSRRRSTAICIQGLWIDRDDLSFSAREGDGTLSVHECQWAKSTDPCGMWIIASRSRLGAHVRKWHRKAHADKTQRCLWDGCARAMLRDSINRHVMTVHLGERFYCHGCNQGFSRQDVYDRHVKNGDLVCREGRVAVVYGTERRIIDAHEALQQEKGAVRHSD